MAEARHMSCAARRTIGSRRGWPVSRILCRADPVMTIPLGRLLPGASSCQPEPAGAKAAPELPPRGSYLALLPVGLAVPGLLPAPRWALTPPFHPYPGAPGRSVLCGAFPRVTPAGRYPAPLPCGVRTFLGGPQSPARPSSHPRARRSSGLRLRGQRGGSGPAPNVPAAPSRTGGRGRSCGRARYPHGQGRPQARWTSAP